MASPSGNREVVVDLAEQPGSEKDERILGIDEAGRGSLLGPLVVGGFVTAASTAATLPALGIRDSKLLSAPQRERAYATIGPLGVRLALHLSPGTIDAHVRRGGLNDLEAKAFGQLARRAGVQRVFVDACDPVAIRFGESVRRWAGGTVEVDARHHADRTIPVVAAASIVAKVRRDRAVARLSLSLGGALGSGYPSDARTTEFVRSFLAEGRPAPSWLRASWKTMDRLLPRPPLRTLETFTP
ncbi:MAG: ribonuclease HII [Thermoplasmata archaeon]|nr:ribonuclease HII [Thermoplasmata archaeon]